VTDGEKEGDDCDEVIYVGRGEPARRAVNTMRLTE